MAVKPNPGRVIAESKEGSERWKEYSEELMNVGEGETAFVMSMGLEDERKRLQVQGHIARSKVNR